MASYIVEFTIFRYSNAFSIVVFLFFDLENNVAFLVVVRVAFAVVVGVIVDDSTVSVGPGGSTGSVVPAGGSIPSSSVVSVGGSTVVVVIFLFGVSVVFILTLGKGVLLFVVILLVELSEDVVVDASVELVVDRVGKGVLLFVVIGVDVSILLVELSEAVVLDASVELVVDIVVVVVGKVVVVVVVGGATIQSGCTIEQLRTCSP